MVSGLGHLHELYKRADEHDRADGARAYIRYHRLLSDIAAAYGFPFERTVAAFAALSPNNDYVGNLRSLVTLLIGVQRDLDTDQITVSTYKHCAVRARAYLTGESDFLQHVRGQKTRAFYQNIVDPTDWEPVTVDGHIALAWENRTGGMKSVRMSRKRYDKIAEDIRWLARGIGILPHQMQATIWFARKRTLGILYDPQFSLFGSPGEGQQVTFRVEDIAPFGLLK